MKPRTKKKLVKVYNKILVGTKRGVKFGKEAWQEGKVALQPIRRFSESTAVSIQDAFAVRKPMNNEEYLDLSQNPPRRLVRRNPNSVDFSTKPTGRFPGIVDKGRVRKRVDFNNLGIDI